MIRSFLPGILFFIVLFCVSTDIGAQKFYRVLELDSPRMHGSDVEVVQSRLSELGIVSVGQIDGWYGPNTARAVETFRMYFGMDPSGTGAEPEGKVSQEVWDNLFSKPIAPEVLELISYAESTDWSEFSVTETTLLGYSTEGGLRWVYTNDGTVYRASFRFFGEMGRADRHLYAMPGDRWAFVEIFVDYTMPMYVEEFTMDVAEASYTVAIRDNSGTWQVDNGQLIESDCDIDRYLGLISAESKD